jgi:CRISPR-associated protein Cas5 subtype I-A
MVKIPMIVYAVTIIPSIFSIQHEVSYQVKVGIPLPPPSTIMGAVARGIGLIKKLTPAALDANIEEGMFVPSFLKLRKAVEDATNLVTIKPLSFVTRSSVLHRIIRFERERREEWSDALIHQVYFTSKFSAYLAMDLELINERLELNLQDQDILKALYSIERLGNTEHHVAPQNIRTLKTIPISNGEVEVDTYVVAALAKPISSYTMLFMKRRSDEKPQPYLLPLLEEANIYKPTKMRILLQKNAIALDIGGEAVAVAERGF